MASTALAGMAFSQTGPNDATKVEIAGSASVFAPGIASTNFSEVRLTISPDGRTAIWFSRNRPGGPGGYDIWISRRVSGAWSAAEPAPFNSPARDFDPAFSSDGRYVYFCSDRPGSIGGDDIYRVRVRGAGFGSAEHLGPEVNSAKNEFAPMLSPDRTKLLFSSDRPGGRGRHDLYIARRRGEGFDAAAAIKGGVNSDADEFDATYLSDSRTIVFARTPNMQVDRIELQVAGWVNGRYEPGGSLPLSVNDQVKDTYGPMLDWSGPNHLTFSGQRDGAPSMDLYTIRYTIRR
jgi:Tol biopolymer transport system component